MYIKHPNKGKNMEEYLDCSLPPCYLSVDKHMVPIIKEMIGKLKVMSDGYWTDVEFGKKTMSKAYFDLYAETPVLREYTRDTFDKHMKFRDCKKPLEEQFSNYCKKFIKHENDKIASDFYHGYWEHMAYCDGEHREKFILVFSKEYLSDLIECAKVMHVKYKHLSNNHPKKIASFDFLRLVEGCQKE